jgi:hypothetical protein
MLTEADRRLVLAEADAIDAARRRGVKHYDVPIPPGLTCTPLDFEMALIEELSHRGKLSPARRRAQA